MSFPGGFMPPIGWSLRSDHDEDDEQERRHFRESALSAAVMLHGEAESQAVFRDHEITEVIEDAKRFFDYIWGEDATGKAG